MALTDKLTAIADAIRSKTGGSDLMTLDGMVEAIDSIVAGGGGSQLDALIERSITEVSSNVTKVGKYAFHSCTNLTTVNLPLVTNVELYAFHSCKNLTTVNSSLANIGASSFTSCSALSAFILRNTKVATLTNPNAFTSTPIASGTGYIYVPKALLIDTDSTKDYRQATNWSTYATQFRALEDWTVDGTITGELDWNKINAAA